MVFKSSFDVFRIHVVRGRLVFFLIPPLDENLELYKRWVQDKENLAGSGSLGDRVKSYDQVDVKAGQTLFVPSGWIAASYSGKDPFQRQL